VVYATNMAIVITWSTLIDEFLDKVPGFTIGKVVSSSASQSVTDGSLSLSFSHDDIIFTILHAIRALPLSS
jgi:hypothetical protein